MKKQQLTAVILSALAAGTLSFAGTASAAASDEVAEDLGETVVTAERIPTENMSTPADVAVVTAEDIASNHYADVAEALNHVDGVVMTNGASGNDQVVRINGEERVVVLVDGERLNDDQGSMSRASATLTRIPSVKDIERIEVVKGAGSALYGSDAVGGVVNIITKKAKENRTEVDLNTGSWKSHNYELYNQGSDGGLSWTVAAGLQKRGDFYYKDQNGDTMRMDGSEYSNNGVSINLRQELADDQSVGLRFAHRTMSGGSPYYSSYGGAFASSPQDQVMNDVSLTYRFKEDTKLPGFLRYFNHYKTADFSGRFTTRMQGIDYQDGWRLDKNNKLVAGAEWHRSNSSHEASGYEDKKITTMALYLQDSMHLADKWTLVPGLRMDHHSEFGTHWSPKVAINYRPDHDTKVYASWGRVFKAPTADDMYYTEDYGAWGSYLGNPDLDPESGHVETIGISHVFAPGTSLDLSYTNSVLHDAIDWYSADGMNYRATNVAEEKKHALTLSWKQRLSEQWSYDLGYTYLHTETDDAYAVSTAKYLKGNSMPNGYRIGLHYHQGPWKANLEGRMGSGLDETYYGDHHYAVFDFNTSYAATDQLTFYAKALNFTNQAYSRYAGWNYPAPGRFFQIGMTYTF